MHVNMKTTFKGLKFGYHQLRLMMVLHLVEEREMLFEEIKEDIRNVLWWV